jgi:hypothetical protein
MGTIDLDISPFMITFNNELARQQMRSINVGDTLYGVGIPQDAMVVSIDYEAYTLLINEPLSRSGDKLITFRLTLNDVGIEDFDDFYGYKWRLTKDGLLDESSFDKWMYPAYSTASK